MFTTLTVKSCHPLWIKFDACTPGRKVTDNCGYHRSLGRMFFSFFTLPTQSTRPKTSARPKDSSPQIQLIFELWGPKDPIQGLPINHSPPTPPRTVTCWSFHDVALTLRHIAILFSNRFLFKLTKTVAKFAVLQKKL